MSGGLPAAALQPHPPAAGSQPVQHAQVGLWWPAADPARLRAAAAAWRSLAGDVEAVSESASAVVRGVAAENQGQAVDAFEAYWGSRWVGGNGALPAVAEGARALADGLDRYAAAVDKARARIEELIVAAATVAIVGVGLTVLTVGISDVAAVAVAETLMAAAATVGIELSMEIAGIIATALVVPAFGAIESGGIDIALQLGHVYGFHDQAGLDWAEVVRWAEVGAVTAPIGAAVGVGVGAAGEVVAPTMGRMASRLGIDAAGLPKWAPRLGQRLTGGIAGSISGASSTAIHDEISFGDINRGDVTAGALAGFVGGAVAAPRGAALAAAGGNRLPNYRRARIDPRKFKDYSLSPDNPGAKGKWRGFVRLGYDVHTSQGREAATQDIVRQLESQLGSSPAVPGTVSSYGMRFEVRTEIVGPNDKLATLVTEWQIDNGQDVPRLITNWVELHE